MEMNHQFVEEVMAEPGGEHRSPARRQHPMDEPGPRVGLLGFARPFSREIDDGDVALGGRIPVNVSGGLLSKGHPLGATGAILTLSCAYALRRKKEKYGLITMCIGGGQGVALIIESL